MKKTFIAVALMTLYFNNPMNAEEGICWRCKQIREYNATHPQKQYDCYEDYLKEKGLTKDLKPVNESNQPQKAQEQPQ